MKKCVSFILLITLLSLFGKVFAQEDEFLSSAILSAKQKVDIPANYTDFNSSVEIGRDEKLAYLSWSGEATAGEPGGNISVAVDNKNRIIGYNHYIYGNYYGDYKLSKIDFNTASVSAKKAIDKMCAEFAGDVKLHQQKNYYVRNNEVYTVVFYRNIYGYPYYDNFIKVDISAFNGEVFSLNAQWYDIDKISPASNIISSYEAKQNYFKKIGVKLGYQKKADSSECFLRYCTAGSGKEFISAYNGELVNTRYLPQEDTINSNYYYNQDRSLAESPPSSVVPDETLELYLRSLPELNISDVYSLYNTNHSSDTAGNYFSLMYFSANGGNDIISVEINSMTKEITSYSHESKTQSEGNILPYDACLKTATDFSNKYLTEKYNQCENGVEYIKPQTITGTYNISFARKVNGLPLSGNGINISIDKLTGKIESLDVTWDTDLVLSSASDVITPDLAFSKMADGIGFELQYVAAAKGGISNPKRMSDLQLLLVYDFNIGKPKIADAKTGEIINSDGSGYFNRFENMYNDIDGHPLQKKIETLYLSGILPYSEKFRPDDAISQKEYLEFVASALGDTSYPSDSYGTINGTYVLDEGEVNPDATVTNENAIKFLVRALGYKDIADLKDTFKTGFVDEGQINPSLIGYAAIAKGKGIFSGNAFMPKAILTRAVAAEILYNLIAS